MCENLEADRIRCDACRTINLARHVRQEKPDMQLYDKSSPTQKICCGTPEIPVTPTCIKVCTREEYMLMKSGKPKIAVPQLPPAQGPGKFMSAVKAGLLVGAVYFTYTQGVWGDQQDVTECIRRWTEHLRSLNTRQPPTYDARGFIVRKENAPHVLTPMYMLYKDYVTSFFSGLIRVPLVIKCAYLDYVKAMERKEAEAELAKKKGMWG